MSIQDPYEQQQPYTAPGAPTAYDPVTGGPIDPGSIPPPPPGGYGPGFVPGPGAPNPMLAALLGFIPGVGAMYNGQFAKGIAHIAIFAVFSSLAKHVNDIFGLFVAGWIFYMVFEAYQTARARREGLPVPDPFGLNNIGDRFGFKGNPDFSHFWGHNGGPPPNANVASETRVDQDGGFYRTRVDASGRQTTFEVDPTGNVYRSSGYGAVPPVPPPPPGYVPPMPPPGATPYGYGATPYGAPGYGMPGAPVAPGAPPVSPYGVPPVSPIPPAPPVPRGGLPTGAIWLIGLGFFALLGSVHQFAFLEGEATGGLFLIALAAFLFWRRYSANDGMYPPGSPAARWNMIRASKGAGVVFIVGLLTFLQGLHIVAWESSWPLLLIFFGVAQLLERMALNGMNSAAGFNPGYPGSYAPPPVSPEPEVETNSPTSIVPKYTRPGNDLSSHNEEGR